MNTLAGLTILMSGGSRGIGLAIALRAARDGANVTLLAKTDQPHPRLEGTVHTAAAAIRDAGGAALAVVGDVRDDAAIARAIQETVETFGGIDIVVNNASAIDISGTLALDPKRYDLMQDVNARGTFMLSRAAIPQLLKAGDPQILTLSPPLNLAPPLAGRLPGLHDLEVLDDARDPRPGPRVRRPGVAGELSMAAHHDPDSRGRQPPRR